METVQALVEAFVAAWPSGQASAVVDLFTEDAVYRNGPLDPVTGRSAIAVALAGMMEMGGTVRVDMVRAVAEGQVVMTERVDYLELEGRTLALPVFGVFEVIDGRIAAWRDYFDIGQFTAQHALDG